MNEHTPSRTEDEYFLRQDAELLKERRARLDAEREAAERRSHFMKCPKCGATLAETTFHQIKVDRCAECGGIWFDGGEVAMLEHLDQSNLRGFVRSLFGLSW